MNEDLNKRGMVNDVEGRNPDLLKVLVTKSTSMKYRDVKSVCPDCRSPV